MMQAEKNRLLALVDGETRWCQDAEARDADGNPVRYDDDTAVAWDITGALCHLFGWQRACELFVQLDRHVNGRRNPERWPLADARIESMAALQDFNDSASTTFDVVRGRIETMRIWHGRTGGTDLA
jgi:hypothetical protein